jgi:gluconokinase
MRTTDPWFLGIDLGTGSCKSIIIDAEAHVLGFGAGNYHGTNVQDRWREQNPESLTDGLIQSVQAAMKEARVRSDACAGLSLGGALHGMLALDQKMRPLTGVMTWADDRALSQAEARRNTSQGGLLYKETGCPIHGMYPLYKILWLREESPQVFKASRWFVSAKEYVIFRLTGELVVDPSLAAGSGLLNTHTLSWSEHSLEWAGITEEQLSPLHSPYQSLPPLREEWAEQLGIPATTPLILGSSDAVNSSLGAGAVKPWQATCMIGTSGAFRVIYHSPVLDELARIWSYAIDKHHWLVGGAINNGGIALEWLQRLINQSSPDSPGEKRLSLEGLLSLARQAGIGASGLLCLPFFAGERSPNWNLRARALFFGLDLEHRAGHLAQSLLEGIAFRMRSLKEMVEKAGVEVKEIRASGGFTQSEWWLQVVANALGQTLLLPTNGETSALGAAVWAMRAENLWEELESLDDFITLDDEVLPQREATAIYDRIYPLYLQLYGALGDAFDHLSEIRGTMHS